MLHDICSMSSPGLLGPHQSHSITDHKLSRLVGVGIPAYIVALHLGDLFTNLIESNLDVMSPIKLNGA